METKETSYKKVLNLTIVKFLCYTILIGFIFILITIWVNYGISHISSLPLSIALSLICGILIFYLLRFICKSSTLEALQKHKLSLENSKMYLSRMRLFFILCTIFSALTCLSFLFIDNFIFANAIDKAYEQYTFISSELAERVVNHILDEYAETFLPKVFSTIILEISLATSFFSLIPYQEKLFNKYNK